MKVDIVQTVSRSVGQQLENAFCWLFVNVGQEACLPHRMLGTPAASNERSLGPWLLNVKQLLCLMITANFHNGGSWAISIEWVSGLLHTEIGLHTARSLPDLVSERRRTYSLRSLLLVIVGHSHPQIYQACRSFLAANDNAVIPRIPVMQSFCIQSEQ